MKAATVNEIKRALNARSANELKELCIRLAAYKRDNKEFLNYLLFEAHDEAAYIDGVKEEISALFAGMNKSSLYLAKKTIRKIAWLINRYGAWSGNKQTEVELLIFFCQQVKNTRLPIHESTVLVNLYQRQLGAINKKLAAMHEDIQFDYQQKVQSLFL